jgi:hypothetical protein
MAGPLDDLLTEVGGRGLRPLQFGNYTLDRPASGTGPLDSLLTEVGGRREAQASAGPSSPRPITMEDLTRSFIGQGAMYGAGDEAEAAARTAYEKYAAGDSRPLDEIYDDELKTARGKVKGFQEEHPIASTVSELGGAIAPALLTRGRSAPGSITRATGRAATVGGAGGAAYGFNTGEGEQNRVTQALTGGAFGLATGAVFAPIVEGVKMAARPIATAFRSAFRPTDEAARRVAGSIRTDRVRGGQALTDEQIAQARANGQPITNLERGGESTRGLARAAADTSSEARDTLNRTINARIEEQGDRVTRKVRALVGSTDSSETRDALRQAARRENQPAYARAYAAGDYPLASDELNRLAGSQIISTAIRRVIQGRGRDRAIADGAGAFNPPFRITEDGRIERVAGIGHNSMPAYPNLQFWDYVKREADQLAKTHGDAADFHIVSQLRDEIDRLTTNPKTGISAYQQARRGAKAYFDADDALKAGENFINKSVDWREAQRAFNAMTPSEKKLFGEGFASALVKTVEKTRDRANVVNRIFGSKDARNRIRIALGPEKAKELEAFLRIEAGIDLARNAVQGNSKTARFFFEALGLGVGANVLSGDANITDPQGLIIGAMLAGGRRGIKRASGRANQAVNKRVAEMLTSDDPNVFMQGIRLVARTPKYMRRLRDIGAILGIGAGQQGAGLLGGEGE